MNTEPSTPDYSIKCSQCHLPFPTLFAVEYCEDFPPIFLCEHCKKGSHVLYTIQQPTLPILLNYNHL